jgi:hypothetical protein
MIRPLTLLAVCAAAGSGLHLYQVKHSVSLLDRELREIHRETERARERTAVLRAEWALLNEPERLRATARQHLALEPMSPAQFTRWEELPRRLPQAEAFRGAPSVFGGAVLAAAPAAAVSVPAAPAMAAAPSVAAEPSAPAAALAAAAALVAPRAAQAASAPPQAPRTTLVSNARSGVQSENLPPLPRSDAPPRPSGEPTRIAPSPSPATAPRAAAPAPVVAQPAPAIFQPQAGSALGGAGSLPPPVPRSPR